MGTKEIPSYVKVIDAVPEISHAPESNLLFAAGRCAAFLTRFHWTPTKHKMHAGGNLQRISM